MKTLGREHASAGSVSLFADLYQLTMMQAYLREGMTGTAVFSLFVRRLPSARNFLLAAGLETVLQAIEAIRIGEEDIAYLSSLGLFSSEFLKWMEDFRFTGDIHAVAEGTPVFGHEPIVEVAGPLPQAQFLETLVINQIHLQTMLASKAARVVAAAAGRRVIDFGARRIHGIETANMAARAFYIAGVDATSNLLAGRCFGIPVSGTMAHSYIQAHDDESTAFEAFAKVFPGSALLIDTYDTLQAARSAIALATRNHDPLKIAAVRLDSGDLLALSREVRSLLDQAELPDVRIIASGSLDEYEIGRLIAAGAPIDSFGVGTNMGVSADAPALDMAYKLMEYDGCGRMKLSAGKVTWPGRKQVFRNSSDRVFSGDVIARREEALQGRPLLGCVMRSGRRIHETQSIREIREYAREQLALLPRELIDIAPAKTPYPVAVSPALQAFEQEVRAKIAKRGDGRDG